LKPLSVAGLCALGLLLFCGASTWLVNAQQPVTPEIEVPPTVYAGYDFYVTLRVINDSTVYSQATGHFWVDEIEEIPPGAIPNLPYEGFIIKFGTLVWTLRFTWSFPSVGTHTLRFSVDYWIDGYFEPTYHVSTPSISVEVQAGPPPPPPPSYTVVWLRYPSEQVRAGKMIHLTFSIRIGDASGPFLKSNKVRIVVDGTDIEATCGTKSGSIRINTKGEYYRWYWKTDSDLPGGAYSVIVLLDSAELARISITIVSKI